MLRNITWILSIFITIAAQNESSFDFISNYLNEEQSKFCMFILCWAVRERIHLQKYVHSNGNSRTMFLNDVKNIDSTLFNNQLTIILDYDCPNAIQMLRKNDDMKYDFSYNWLIITKTTQEKWKIENLLSGVKLRLDSKFRFAITHKQNEIHDVFLPGVETNLKIRNFRKNFSSFYDMRKNLQGVLIRTGNRENFTSIEEEDYLDILRTKDRVQFQIFNFQIFVVLKEAHHFHFNLTRRHVWFGNESSGIDGGLSQLVHERKIDISTSGGYLRPARIDYYDFLMPLYKFRSAFIFVNPDRTGPGLEILKPFAIDTWYILVLSLIIIGISIYLTFRFESKSKYSLCSSMLVTISVISQQGSSIVPSRTGGRIIFLTLLIMSMMIYNYYTSSLVSSLLSNVPRPMKTIKELYESDLKVAIEPLPYLFSYILQHKDDRFISLLNRTKIYEKGVLNAASAVRGIEKVKRGTHAYLTELSTAFSCLADSDQDVVCDLADIIFIPFGDIGLVAQKRWQYTELFHITLRKILSSGIFRRIEDFWVSKRPKCLNKTRIKAVGVPELFLIYLIFVIGLIISLIIFLIESLLHKYR